MIVHEEQAVEGSGIETANRNHIMGSPGDIVPIRLDPVGLGAIQLERKTTAIWDGYERKKLQLT